MKLCTQSCKQNCVLMYVMYLWIGLQLTPRWIQVSAEMGLNPKVLDAFEEPRLPWLAGFGVLCTTFVTAALAPAPHLETAGQQWVLKYLQIFAFLRHTAFSHLGSVGGESITFLKYVPADVLGNNVSHTAGILELQAQRTSKASSLSNPLSKSTLIGLFYSGLTVCIMQTLACI